ncbi:MAG: hypothetical protein QOD35_607, partial [Nocardioidaceae bacterium]|nr:hypothetical protein [Nocardioidaceae bacterium]
MYRTHAAHLLTIAFVVYLAAVIIEAILAGLLGVVGALLASIVGIIAAFLLQAALVKAVEDVRDGRVDLSLSETLQVARPFVGRVAIASILAGIAIGLGLVLLIVPGLFLITIWAVVIPVVVIEQPPMLSAFGRSRQLVRGRGWNVFGTLVTAIIILILVNLV